MDDRPVFIIGLHRTGSTLLRNIVAAGKDIAILPEELHLWSAYPWRTDITDLCPGKRMSREEAKDFLDVLFSGRLYGAFWRKIAEYGIEKQAVESRLRDGMSCMDVVNEVFDEYIGNLKASRWGAKYPVHIAGLARLEQWYPEARLIHLTRDPRAIYVSKSKDEASRRRKEEYPVLSVFFDIYTMFQIAFEYHVSARVHRKHDGNEGYMLLRYEDLLKEPEKQVKRTCSMAGIRFDESMLDAFGKPSSLTGEVKKGIDPSRARAWERVIRPWERIFMDILTFRSRKTLGYGGR